MINPHNAKSRAKLLVVSPLRRVNGKYDFKLPEHSVQPAAPLSDPTPDELLGNLNEYTGGIWYDDPRALEKLSTYLS